MATGYARAFSGHELAVCKNLPPEPSHFFKVPHQIHYRNMTKESKERGRRSIMMQNSSKPRRAHTKKIKLDEGWPESIHAR